MPTPAQRQQRALTAPVKLGDKLASKRAVARIRSTLAELAEANLQGMQDMLDTVAMTNPAEALRIMLQLMEFSVPKLSRVEVQDDRADPGDMRALTMDALARIVREERERQEGGDSEQDALRALLE